jgi:hypothetical protein
VQLVVAAMSEEDEMRSGSRSVRLPTFDGKSTSFAMWWIRFLSFATVYKFRRCLEETDEPDLPPTEATVLDETKDADKLMIAAKRRNGVAMANFTMAFTSEVTMGMILKSLSSDWPSGKASIVTKLLKNKFKPDDTMTRVELRQELNKVSMKKTEDPARLFERIAAIENRYAGTATTVNKVEYQAVLTSERRQKGTAVTIENLEEVMNEHCLATDQRRRRRR